MNKITEVTKRDIIDILFFGITLQETKVKYDYLERPMHYDEPYDVKMFYWGRLDEISFLQRLYKLNELPSSTVDLIMLKAIYGSTPLITTIGI